MADMEHMKKTLVFAWSFVMLAIFSCTSRSNEFPPQPTSTETVLPPTNTLTATAETTSTPALVVTPTLGIRSSWRNSSIAFASNRNGTYQIYLMQPDGANPIQLTRSSGDNFSPAWSKDAKRIAFESTRDGNSEIYIMDADGGNQTNFSVDFSNDHTPIWLNNNKLAFVSDRNGRERIFVVDADGRNIQSFQYTSVESSSQIICLKPFGDGWISFTIDENGARTVRIVDTSTGEAWTPGDFNGDPVAACPEGSSLYGFESLIISNRDGHDEIYKFNFNNLRETQLTSNPEPSLGPSWTSSRDWLSFYSRRSGNWDIFVMQTNGKEQWNITNNPAEDIQPAWQPY